jgi:Calcineurin-like phosphoesterase
VKIGHISDLHLNNTFDRRARVIHALSQANAAGAKHLLVTGDLTAHGHPSEFQELAGILAVNWCGGTTIVPGNHDSGPAFNQIFGPLALPSDIGDALIVPLDTRVKRRSLVFRALGRVGKQQMRLLDWLTTDVQKPTIIVAHHGPIPSGLWAFDGLVDRAAVKRLLCRSPLIHICCGHDHRVLDIGNQIHTAASCALHPDPLRLYDVGVGGFSIAYRSAYVGTTGFAGPPRV